MDHFCGYRTKMKDAELFPEGSCLSGYAGLDYWDRPYELVVQHAWCFSAMERKENEQVNDSTAEVV